MAILEQNDYLPFGTRIDLDSVAYDQSNRYRFNGKEEQVTGSLGLIDYGARLYDNLLPRWTTPDPLAEKYYSYSPYAFCNNNPVNFVDPDGEAFETVSDIISLGIGIRSFAKNLKEGNMRGAIGDGVGIVFDAAAVFVPFMPGDVGYIRQGSRVVNLMDAGGDFLRLTGELQSFEKAAEFGVDTYKNLRKNVDTVYGKGSGLQVHHLIEKRLASKLGINEDDIPAIVLTKEEHQKFTNAWRNEIGYKGDKTDINTTNADADAIMEAAQRIYKDYPELLRFINECFK